MYFDTGSSNENLPCSNSVIIATMVIGLVIDQIGNSVSALMSRSPCLPEFSTCPYNSPSAPTTSTMLLPVTSRWIRSPCSASISRAKLGLRPAGEEPLASSA